MRRSGEPSTEETKVDAAHPEKPAVSQKPAWNEVQAVLLPGYGAWPDAWYLLLQVEDAACARRSLGALLPLVGNAAQVLHETRFARAGAKKAERLAFALSAAGFEALRASHTLPHGFSHEFRMGSSHPRRARVVGDTGVDAPENWFWGKERGALHALAILYFDTGPGGDDEQGAQEVRQNFERRLPGFRVLHGMLGRAHTHEPFGFRDGISQPRLEGAEAFRSAGAGQANQPIKAGEFLLGYVNEFSERPRSPFVPRAEDSQRRLRPHPDAPAERADFGFGGSFLVLRQLEQDVEGFRRFVEHHPDGERMAARIFGRWKSGAPLVRAPDADDPALAGANDFDYHDVDPHGLRCPLGAHIRRANPRDALTLDDFGESPAFAASLVRGRRIIRRSRTYREDGKTGLLFGCLCADLERQFEFIQQQWFHQPGFSGLGDENDPLTVGGAFSVQRNTHSTRVRLGKWVRVRGSAYFFLPSLPALHYLASR